MNPLDFESVRKSQHLVYEVVSGSRSYGLDTPESDWDYKGVFIVPQDHFYGLDYPDQLQDERNDVVYYELGKFFRLLGKSNPNILEILAVDEGDVKKNHPGLRSLDLSRILSKQCCDTFGGYALSQIRKARGVKSRINSPEEETKRTPLDYCTVIDGAEEYTLPVFLEKKGRNQANCSLAEIADCPNTYRLYDGGRGILDDDNPHQLKSGEAKDYSSIGIVIFNRGQFTAYRKEYKGYWEWRANRVANKLSTDALAYDGKNMMHTFRLLDMAKQIATRGEIILRSVQREFLLDVRYGKLDFNDLVKMAEDRLQEVNAAFAACNLPKTPDAEYLHEKLVNLRKEHYQSTS